ncbi:MAG TPA: type II toxin-antitoxin system HicA family toxin [Candidatus Saccharimonadales bacterium]|nr:type II toxin-antitoxin system HicA family toxin [Candidatus Saccharimonadales bacterium]
MAKIPQISGKTAVKIFSKIGYRVVRQKGSHIRLHHPDKKPLTVPDHKVLGKGLLRKLLRDSELSIEDFMKLM